MIYLPNTNDIDNQNQLLAVRKLEKSEIRELG